MPKAPNRATLIRMQKEASWEVLIIGAGSARLSSAIYLQRARRRVLIVDALFNARTEPEESGHPR